MASPTTNKRRSARETGTDRGEIARQQLVSHATRIFAEKGYAAASTREICEAAGVNVAAIHYYFGDKEGLYRQVLLRPIEQLAQDLGRFDDPALSFEEAMRQLFAPFLVSDGDDLEAQAMRLHLREMFEPTAVFREITEKSIVPLHLALCAVLARHCALERIDDDIHRLAFALIAMAHDYCLSRNFMQLLAPAVLDQPDAMARTLERLVGYSRALLDQEIARRDKNTR